MRYLVNKAIYLAKSIYCGGVFHSLEEFFTIENEGES